tara:strand:+ start:2484 stop:2711 length:228 start_codon:yes stop_codon:yes gene_type:complete
MRQRHNLLANQVLYVACQLEETSFSFNATPEFLCDLGINDASVWLAWDLSAEIKSERQAQVIASVFAWLSVAYCI